MVVANFPVVLFVTRVAVSVPFVPTMVSVTNLLSTLSDIRVAVSVPFVGVIETVTRLLSVLFEMRVCKATLCYWAKKPHTFIG